MKNLSAYINESTRNGNEYYTCELINSSFHNGLISDGWLYINDDPWGYNPIQEKWIGKQFDITRIKEFNKDGNYVYIVLTDQKLSKLLKETYGFAMSIDKHVLRSSKIDTLVIDFNTLYNNARDIYDTVVDYFEQQDNLVKVRDIIDTTNVSMKHNIPYFVPDNKNYGFMFKSDFDKLPEQSRKVIKYGR